MIIDYLKCVDGCPHQCTSRFGSHSTSWHIRLNMQSHPLALLSRVQAQQRCTMTKSNRVEYKRHNSQRPLNTIIPRCRHDGHTRLKRAAGRYCYFFYKRISSFLQYLVKYLTLFFFFTIDSILKWGSLNIDYKKNFSQRLPKTFKVFYELKKVPLW